MYEASNLVSKLNEAAAENVSAKGGYYTVHVDMEGMRMPYIVFAVSDYHAARKVREETGYLARQHDVEGPRKFI